MTYEEIITRLHELSNPEKVTFKAKKFGVIANQSLGIYQKDLNVLAKQIGKDKNLAIKLFDSNIYEGRVLCAKIFPHQSLTNELLEKWVSSFENWEICDSFCMGLVAKSEWAIPKIEAWTTRKNEFEKRAGFTTIASYCMADKKAENDVFEAFFYIILREVKDDRLYVKKAVNWALRNIGKRNPDLRLRAIQIAYEILEIDHKSAQWIAKNALRELTQKNRKCLDYPRHIYRK